MRRARKFLSLAWPDKLLLVETTVALGAVRLGLWLLPFRMLTRMIVLATARPTRLRGAVAAAQRIPWAVAVGSSYVPGATCLTQALAAKLLLARRGQPTQLRMGVARDERGQFEAHAWLECQGKIVIGGRADLFRYSLLPMLEAERA